MRFVRSVVAGALAGCAGTAAMVYTLYRRYRAGGGTDGFRPWEFAAGTTTWKQASAPGQLGEKVERLVLGHEPDDRWARPTTNAAHWATGIGWGVEYGVVASIAPALPWLRALGLGPLAWLSGYVVLPLAGVYEPIWKYDARTLRDDLSDHLVYGAVTSAAFALLTRDRRGRSRR